MLYTPDRVNKNLGFFNFECEIFMPLVSFLLRYTKCISIVKSYGVLASNVRAAVKH